MAALIDKHNPTPLYYQLQQIIKEQISSGVYKPGNRIPTELELSEIYGISRATIRQAILALVNDGYLVREKSKGTIVTSPTGRMRFVGSLMSFSHEMNRKGILHHSQTLEQKVIPASPIVAEKLQLLPSDQVYYLKRVRFVSGQPYLVDEHFIPYSLCQGIDTKYEENTSLYNLLQQEYAFNLHHGQIEFEPIAPPSKEIADLLKVYATTNLLLVERIVYSETDRPLDYFVAVMHGKFSIDVVTSYENSRGES